MGGVDRACRAGLRNRTGRARPASRVDELPPARDARQAGGHSRRGIEWRLILGLGAGWNQREYAAFGIPYDKRVSRFEEAFTIIRELLRTGRSDFHGVYYDVEDCVLDPSPVRPGGPPLMLGSISPRMLRIGLPHVDAWNVWWSDYGNAAEGFEAVRARVEDAIERVGRVPGEVEATAAVLVQLPGGVGRLMGETYNDRTVRPILVDDLAEHLGAMADAGATHLQLVLDPITVESVHAAGGALRKFRNG